MNNWHEWIKKPGTRIMGILNSTPDSFFEQSRLDGKSLAEICRRAQKMEADGADCLDLGGESSRPGSLYVSEAEELDRLIPVLKAIRPLIKIPISIDTRKAEVADQCIDAGADIINDISALEDDAAMAAVCARHKVPVILMHKKGRPDTMQQAPAYENCKAEVLSYLKARVAFAESQGIRDYALDPGIGFGKTYEHNRDLLQNLDDFVSLNIPILLGVSRKGFIAQSLADAQGIPRPVEGRLVGSLALAARAYEKGVKIIRVHDVFETKDLYRIFDIIRKDA